MTEETTVEIRIINPEHWSVTICELAEQLWTIEKVVLNGNSASVLLLTKEALHLVRAKENNETL